MSVETINKAKKLPSILLASALFVAAIYLGTQLASAAVTVSKQGVDTTTNSNTQTQPGNTVRWVLNYSHTGALGEMTLTDPIPAGTQFVPGSFVVPGGYEAQYSTNGTLFDGIEPISGVTHVRAKGPAPPSTTESQGASVVTGLLPPPQSFSADAAAGDGTEAFFWGNNIYNINHHNDGTMYIQCHPKNQPNPTTAAVCPGFPTYVSPVAHTPATPSPFGSGPAVYRTPNLNWGGIDQSTGRVYLPMAKTDTDDGGIACLDLSNHTSCGFTDMGVAGNDIAGGTKVGNNIYVGDRAGNILCFNITSNSACASPYPFDAFPALSSLGVNAGGGGPDLTLDSFDNRYVFYIFHASNDPATPVNEELTRYISCIDTTNNQICPNFPVSYSIPDLGTHNIVLAPITNASGAITGICGEAAPASETSAPFACFNLTGGVEFANPWGQLVPNAHVGSFAGQGKTLLIGTKLYLPYRHASPDTEKATYACWDYSINAECAAFQKMMSTKTIKPYSLREDPYNPGCIWEVGDHGEFEVFDATLGGRVCSRSTGTAVASITSFYCGGRPSDVTHWQSVEIRNLDAAATQPPRQYERALLTIRDSSGNPVAPYNNYELSLAELTTGSVDISSLQISSFEQLSATLSLVGVDGNAWDPNAPQNLNPYIMLAWDAEYIQFCFETEVTRCSQVDVIANTASFLTIDETTTQQGQTDEASYSLSSTGATCTSEVVVNKTVSSPTYTPGDQLTYTINIVNNGDAAETNFSFIDNLSDVLDDGTFVSVTNSGDGTATFDGPNQQLTYTNASLDPDETDTITYTITTANPGTGNNRLENSVISSTGNCVQGNTDARCRTLSVGPNVNVVKSASASSANPGDTITYTIIATNTGAAPSSNYTFTDDLSDVIDDALFNNNVTFNPSGSGSANFNSPNLEITIPSIPVNNSVTLTYTVTVNNPVNGNKRLVNTIVNSTNCPTGSTVPDCRPVIPITDIAVSKTVSDTTFELGDTLTYTVTVTNNGEADANNFGLIDNLSAVLDDASYNNDHQFAQGTGTLSFNSPNLTYNGNIAVGETVIFTYSVTTHNPGSGDKLVTNAVTSTSGNCMQGNSDPNCTTTARAPYIINKKTVSQSEAKPGDVITYTLTIENRGTAAHPFLNVTDIIDDVVDDATYNNDAQVVSGPGLVLFQPGNPGPTSIAYEGSFVPAGAVIVITYSFTVDQPPQGNKSLNNRVVGEHNCPPFNQNPDCVTITPISNLVFEKTVDKTTAQPGEAVNYTITITNDGNTAANNISFTDDLTPILDDATFNNNISVTGLGSAAYNQPNITYSVGSIAVGATETITFSVTVNNPPAGDTILTNRIVSNSGNCQQDSQDAKCQVVTNAARLEVSKTTSRGVAAPGDTITYTLVVASTGTAAYNGVNIVDDLSDVIDDATYNNDHVIQTPGVGTVGYAAPNLTYSVSSLPAGQSTTITYSVTVNNPPAGNKQLKNTVVCPQGNNDPRCETVTDISNVITTKVADRAVFNPGETINYTITITNDGKAGSESYTFTDDLTNVLDDATFNNNITVTGGNGSAAFNSPNLIYTDDGIAPGETITITYSVTANDPGTGDKVMTNRVTSNIGNCVQGSSDTRCTTTLHGPNVMIQKQASFNGPGDPQPGDVVNYTITVSNTGGANATNVSYADDLTDVLDDATFNNDEAVNGQGSAEFTSPNVNFSTALLPAGQTSTVTFSVTLKKPATGNKLLKNVITSNKGNCQSGSIDTRCRAEVEEANVVPVKAVSAQEIIEGGTVVFTVIITNNGTGDAANVLITDNFSDILDDATYNDDHSLVGVGSVAYIQPTLTYSNPLMLAGETATVTYSFKANNPVTGNRVMRNAVVGPACPPGTADPNCVKKPRVKDLPNPDVDKVAEPKSAYRGQPLVFTITYSNLPTTANPNPSPSPNAVVKEVVPEHTVFRASGSSPGWSCQDGAPAGTVCTLNVGTIAPGQTGTAKFAVLVDKNLPESVKVIKNVVSIKDDCSNGCPPVDPPPKEKEVPVARPHTKKAVRTSQVKPGEKLVYTVLISNTGEGTAYMYSFHDDMSDVLDDATYNNDATAPSGHVTFSDGKITWTGDIEVGKPIVLTYSVTIKDHGSGNGRLKNVLVDTKDIGNCNVGSTDPDCSKDTPVAPNNNDKLSPTGQTVKYAAIGALGLTTSGVLLNRKKRKQ